MALVLKDRVRESSTTSGTGSITLAGAYTGYQSFATAIANGSTVYYTIRNTTAPNDGEWEVGVGTFTSPSTLSRDTVFSSSTGGSKVAFSAASVLEVFVTQPAEQALYTNQATGKVEVFGNGTNTVTFTEINTTNLTANTVTLTAGTITTNATNNTDITNKLYVDTIAATGLSYHTAVQAATTQSLAAQTGGTVTYNQPNGAGNGVGATITLSVALNTLDGYSLSNTNRVLVKDETNQTYNGVYTWATGGTVLTRSTDTDTYGSQPNQLSLNDYFYVQNGNTNKGSAWVVDSPTGTITFGTSNIAFAQFSSAQVYSAGTGLSLTNTTFSISNTTVTAATYGDAGTVATFTVNAQGQLTAASNAAINASSITVGTLANARTTASDANGASTIVARDSTGSFTANTITATTSNATTFNGTTGAFTNVSGNGSAISAINASNISSGTIANARTTASDSNSASTIVARDANGSFGANIITATFSGNAAGLSAINASNISSGTIANARTTAASANGASTIVLRDSGGSFDANTVNAVSLIGNASQVTAINASNISSGTIANARTTASSSNGASTIVLRGASGEFAAGAITGASFSGNGSAITAINASAITTGTIDNARTTAASANGASTIVARDAGGNFSANTITATTFSGAHSGDGSALTNINASNISSGTIANARTTATSANGASTIVARDANGSFSANIVTASFSGNGVTITDINASNLTSGTVPAARVSGSYTSITGVGTLTAGTWNANVIANAYTTASSSNGASTIVSRDASGAFAAGAITGTSITNSGLTANRVTYATTGGQLTDSANMVFATQYNTGANPALYSLYGVAVGTGTLSYPSTNTGVGFYSRGGTSMGGILVQDGNGRLNQYWNAYTDAGIKYIVSGEASARYLMSVNSTTGGLHAWYGAPSGTAGSAITFTQMGQMTSGTGGSIWFSQRGTSSDFFMGTSGGVSIGNTTDPGASNLSVTGTVTAASFSGAGTGLTGTASGLSIGGSAASATTATTATNWGSYGAVPAAGTSFGNANTIGRSDANGYTYFNYINSNTANNENPTVSQVIVTNGSDNFYRKSSISSFTSAVQTNASGTWGISISGSAASATTATTATNQSGGTVSATTVQASGGFTATSAAPFYTNATTVSSNYTVPSSFNAMSAGPITINSGVTVTVSTGSSWVIV